MPGDQTISAATDTININPGTGRQIVLGDAIDMRGTIDGGAKTTPSLRLPDDGAGNLGFGTTGLAATLGNDQEIPPTARGHRHGEHHNYNVNTRTFDIGVTVADCPGRRHRLSYSSGRGRRQRPNHR